LFKKISKRVVKKKKEKKSNIDYEKERKSEYKISAREKIKESSTKEEYFAGK